MTDYQFSEMDPPYGDNLFTLLLTLRRFMNLKHVWPMFYVLQGCHKILHPDEVNRFLSSVTHIWCGFERPYI